MTAWVLCSIFAMFVETYSEQLLLEHETELEKVKTFYENNKDMLIKIEKRRELWNKMVAFDEKENDPNRFRNRGGNLLAEEKEKKRVVSQLPKVGSLLLGYVMAINSFN